MHSHLLGTYRPLQIAFSHGEGAYLYASDGRYLDFAAGIATLSLGHCHPRLVRALREQAGKYWHCSNMYRIEEAEALAARLCALSFADRVFFANSGSEAVECGLKIIRRYQFNKGRKERTRILSLRNGFHGRTISNVALTANPILFEGFVAEEPAGFDAIAMNDMQDLCRLQAVDVAGIVVELIQGEGGLDSADPNFLAAMRDICTANDVVLMVDEVQTGVGRTGKLFAYQHYGIEPDIVTLAKGLGGGYPIGACMAKVSVCECMTYKTHGSTLGGNPLACRIALEVLDEVCAPGFLENVEEVGLYMRERLRGIEARFPEHVPDIRGTGLMTGFRSTFDQSDIVAACIGQRLLVGKSAKDVIKLTPPLIIDRDTVDQAMERIESALAGLAETATRTRFAARS